MKMRPDIFYIEGLTQAQAACYCDSTQNAATSALPDTKIVPKEIRDRCLIHLLEVGFCTEGMLESRLIEKHLQHAKLFCSLQVHGWKFWTDQALVMLQHVGGPCWHQFRTLQRCARVACQRQHALGTYA